MLVREISPIEMVGFIPVFVDEMFPVIVQVEIRTFRW